MKNSTAVIALLAIGMATLNQIHAGEWDFTKLKIALIVPYRQIEKNNNYYNSYALLFNGDREDPQISEIPINPTVTLNKPEKRKKFLGLMKNAEQQALLKLCKQLNLPYENKHLSYLQSFFSQSTITSFWIAPCLPEDKILEKYFLIIGDQEAGATDNDVIAKNDLFGEGSAIKAPDDVPNQLFIDKKLKDINITIEHGILAPDKTGTMKMAKISDRWDDLKSPHNPNAPQIPNQQLVNLAIKRSDLKKIELEKGSKFPHIFANIEADPLKNGQFKILVYWAIAAIPETSKEKFKEIENEMEKDNIVPRAKKVLGITDKADATLELESLANMLGQILVESK